MIFDEKTDHHLYERVSEVGTTDLASFTRVSFYPLPMIYRSFGHIGSAPLGEDSVEVLPPCSWTERLRQAGLAEPSSDTTGGEKFLLDRAHRFLHVDDEVRAQRYLRIANPLGPFVQDMDAPHLTAARMLVGLLTIDCPCPQPSAGVNPIGPVGDTSLADALYAIRRYPAFYQELKQLLAASTRTHRHHFAALPRELGASMLRYHATYQPIELYCALSGAPLDEMVAISNKKQEPVYFDSERILLGMANLQMNRATDEQGRKLRYTRAITPRMMAWYPPVPGADPVIADYVARHRDLGIRLVAAVRPPNLSSNGFMLLGPISVKSVVTTDDERPEYTFTLDKSMPTDLVSDWLSCGC
ncbi:hypothetical protein ACFSSC_07120 [Corynebacterium mendelii]|uniref:Uncharacterized protein n=1 Tax=Corynebacterium mendelii TaxID=2765362 RepID=A0A939IXW5_9CORY|nr:hypothetical protein [Corynebacterium mendelii]MBN9644900.1 hypothetical protein [Corynebacterium mendelii]